jgi:hypothetical protein
MFCVVTVQHRERFGSPGRPIHESISEVVQRRRGAPAHRIAVQELRGRVHQDRGSNIRVRSEIWYEPVEFTKRRLVPCRRMQTSGVDHGRTSLIYRAAGGLVARLRGSKVFQHKCESVAALVHRGEVTLRDVEMQPIGDLTVERRLAPVAQLAGGATCRIGGWQLYDQPIRTIASVVANEQPITLTHLSVANWHGEHAGNVGSDAVLRKDSSRPLRSDVVHGFQGRDLHQPRPRDPAGAGRRPRTSRPGRASLGTSGVSQDRVAI